MAPKVKNLYCIDPSNLALLEARENLREFKNCFFECADVDSNSLKIASQDFGYCLGVLHHLRDLELGLKCCTNKLKKGAPFLLYLYYRFDNKPLWFQMIWKISDFARYIISRLPYPLKLIVSQVIAFIVYFPLVKFALALERMGFDVRNIPLSSYRNKGFYFMRTDALDRFGTKLEKRITKAEMQAMMIKAGLECIRFSTTTPYWVAVGIKR